MKERGLISYPHEIRAILNGSQTQFRRVIKPQPTEAGLEWREMKEGFAAWQDPGLLLDEHSEDGGACQRRCPYGEKWNLSENIKYNPPSRLWARETWKIGGIFSDKVKIVYRASINGPMTSAYEYYHPRNLSSLSSLHNKWRPSIHMPRWASRITLEIVNVRVERVQEITERDIIKEGITSTYSYDQFEKPLPNPVRTRSMLRLSNMIALWDAINAKRGFGWDANPWVWVIGFQRKEE